MAAISYIGEALLRLGGGSWVWNEDPASVSYDLPLARPDDELDLSPVSPMHLLVEAVRRRTGHEFARGPRRPGTSGFRPQGARPGVVADQGGHPRCRSRLRTDPV
ncbi:MAG: hypothetical protein M3492_03460 [Actinomycetota bacterium]|nr:hypothetical protein [Actinomycetota bacterium]